MPRIQICNIDPGTRFRKDLGDIDQLCYSIEKYGLLTPILVVETERLKFQHEITLLYLLLAGARRLHCMKKLNPIGYIPARFYTHEVTPLLLRELELAEGSCTKPLDFVEETYLKLQISNLKTT